MGPSAAHAVAMLPLHHSARPRRRPLVTWALLLINAAVFVAELRDPEVVRALALVPAHPTVPSALAHIFLHGSVLHLLGNLWFLAVFGGPVEGALGRWRYLGFYLVCGLLASVLHVVSEPGSVVPLVGASGAISGVMGAFLRLHPGLRVKALVVILPLEIPAWALLLTWAGLQTVHAFSSLAGQAGGVAFWAHVGGFAVGFCWMAAMLQRGSRRRGKGRGTSA